VNRELEAKARGLAGLKGYTTNLSTMDATRRGASKRAVPHADSSQ
jgi:hypothetical protein